MAEIALPDGTVALVDDGDLPSVARYHWRANRRGYVGAWSGGKDGEELSLHRLIAEPRDGQVVDHISGDRRDNRRANLRLCTHRQNLKNRRISAANTSGFTGVSANRGRWAARIMVDGRTLCLGGYASPVEAARAYDAAARLHFGEFARTNFPTALETETRG